MRETEKLDQTNASCPVRMMPCHKAKTTGGACTAIARVEREDRTYETRVSWDRGGAFERVLLETRYFLNCPACGTWQRVDKAKLG